MFAHLRHDLTELLRLAFPVVGTRLGIMMMGLTDTIVVGRHSTTELGYVALGWAPAAVVLTTGIGLLSGVQVMTARRTGEGRPDLTGAVLRRGLVYAFWLGLAASILLSVMGPAFLRATGVAPDLAAGAGRVLVVFAWSLVPSLIGVVCSSYLEALGRPAQAMWAMWAANLLNLAFQLVLVPGGFGLPAFGAVGAAWGTFAARLALMIALGVYLVRMADARALGLFLRPARDRAAEFEQRKIGYGGGAALFVETGAFSGMNVIAGWIGGLAVAGWAVVLNFAAIVFMVPLGLAAAASVLVARAHGADDRPGVARAGLTAFLVTIAFTGAVSLIVWPGAGSIAGLYTRDPMLAAAVSGALVLACLFFVADGLQVVGSHMLRARGDVWLPMVVQIASYAAVMLPLGWALALPAGLGLEGIVWAVVAASLLSAGLLVWRFWALARR
jgi:MATE family multidrug resistance protein